MEERLPKTKRGRQPVTPDFKTRFKLQKDAMEFLLKYFYTLDTKKIFKKGQIKMELKDNKVVLHYVHGMITTAYSIELPIDIISRREFDELHGTIKCFLINVYYCYEWEKGALKGTELAVLQGVTKQAMSNYIHETLDTIKKKYALTIDENWINEDLSHYK